MEEVDEMLHLGCEVKEMHRRAVWTEHMVGCLVLACSYSEIPLTLSAGASESVLVAQAAELHTAHAQVCHRLPIRDSCTIQLLQACVKVDSKHSRSFEHPHVL